MWIYSAVVAAQEHGLVFTELYKKSKNLSNDTKYLICNHVNLLFFRDFTYLLNLLMNEFYFNYFSVIFNR